MKIFLFLGIAVGFWGRLLAGEQATAVATVTAGFVTGINVTAGGSSYISEPAVMISGGGGSGATAKAILTGDKVSLIVVLTAGNGYSSAPTVAIEAPPKTLEVMFELVPKLTVTGPAGGSARVESAMSLSGPWTTWTNVTVSADGVVLVDLSPGSAARFYRAVAGTDPTGIGPAGFVWIAPGTFVMGSPLSDASRYPDEVQHPVTLTKGFWFSDHETTQVEYQSVMGSNPSQFQGDGSRPVEQVSWNDAVAYCQKLTERDRAAGSITAQQAYRLPTESEWEYAVRAGTTGALYGNLDAIAWWSDNSGASTHPVKQKVPNAWGIYDMNGNVWEWCADWYGEYPTGSVTDPTGPGSGSFRVCRGGGWGRDVAGHIRSAVRSWAGPGTLSNFLGFRPVLGSVR